MDAIHFTTVVGPDGVIRPPTGTILPQGEIQVLVRPAAEALPIDGDRRELRMREEDWPTTPDGIAALLARMDQVEPGWLSPEDEAAWRAAVRAEKELDKARFFEDAEIAATMPTLEEIDSMTPEQCRPWRDDQSWIDCNEK
jgi:hypothetical protein